ncbi:alpha-mannosidase I MNS4, partial [Tanacetum coccineum]
KLCSDLLEHMDKSWMNIVHRLSDPRYELGVMKFLYKATRDPRYLDVGRDIVSGLVVEFHKQEDHMESFFLAETV